MRRLLALMLGLSAFVASAAPLHAQAPADRWSESKAKEWYDAQPWLVGSNYIPATAINELEMWQADTFDPATIDKELGWAESLGMTTMRVFLHDLAWQQDPSGYRARIDRFLAIAAKHHIRPLFVLFDSCWDPDPRLGPQRAPTPGVHNSGWLQSPGAKALQDPKEYPRLRAYVMGVVGAFGRDPRVLAWDTWNEPDNTNTSSYGAKEPAEQGEPRARAAAEGVRVGAGGRRRAAADLGRVEGRLVGRRRSSRRWSASSSSQSDVISFHNYDSGPEFEKRIQWLAALPPPDPLHGVHGARQREHVPGLAADREDATTSRPSTGGSSPARRRPILPWDSWQKPYVDREPAIWFHEIFKQDGTPYRQDEVDLIRSLTKNALPVGGGR